MKELIEKFICWWKEQRIDLAKELFHKDIYIKDCGSGNAKELWLSSDQTNTVQDFKLVKVISAGSEASIIFEQTDEITNLYYRFAIYLKAEDGKLIEVVSTKESVANENML